MRHRNSDRKLGRTSAHRRATVASLVCHLIREKRIRTTLAKAREARRQAEKMVTLARKGTLAARRQAAARLRDEAAVEMLVKDLAPTFEGRAGGYTRILKMGRRSSDGSEMALLEWVDVDVPDKTRTTSKDDAGNAA